MTKDHLAEEKTSLQKSLLFYESQHGRPVIFHTLPLDWLELFKTLLTSSCRIIEPLPQSFF